MDRQLVTIITAGTYSGYRMECVVRWLKGTPQMARDTYVKGNLRGNTPYGFEVGHFIAFLLREGYAEEVEAQELHLGDYGEVHESLAPEPILSLEDVISGAKE